jgi:hypothetical protein
MDMKKLSLGLLIIPALLLLAGLGSAFAADISQGKVLSYDKEKQIITIDEYDLDFTPEHKYGKSTGKKAAFNMSKALVGALPSDGDIVRIAYKKEGEQNMVIRLMNLSKQDLMKK